MEVAELITHILDTHHAPLKAAMPSIDARLEAQGAPDRLMKPWRSLKLVLEEHLNKEENFFFPNVLAVVGGEPAHAPAFEGPLAQMAHEHQQIRSLQEEVRDNLDAAGDVRADLLALIEDLDVHATREDDDLFPKVRKLWEGDDESQTASSNASEDGAKVKAMCTGAQGWHDRFRTAIADFGVVFAGMELTPRFTAPWDHFTRGLLEHLREEETELFPALIAIADGKEPESDSWKVHLNEMQMELDEIRTISDALRSAATELGEHEQPLLELLDELEEHARREEEELWPAAMSLIGEGPANAPKPPPGHPPLDRPDPSPRRGPLRRTASRLKGLFRRR